MWLILGRVAIVVGIVAGIVQTIQAYEQSRALPRWLGWLTVIPDIPGPLLNIVITLSVLVAVWIGLSRLKRISDIHDRGASIVVVEGRKSGTVVQLGEREFELGPGAYEVFQQQPPENKAKLLRLMRRVRMFNLGWSKEDFLMEVDEKQRVDITLARFLEDGDKIKGNIEAEVLSRHLAEARRAEAREIAARGLNLGDLVHSEGIFAGLFQNISMPDYRLGRMQADANEWREKVTEFLKRERPGMAPEFSLSMELANPPRVGLEHVAYELGVLLVRLLDIKRRLFT